jgi:hypothetical protein
MTDQDPTQAYVPPAAVPPVPPAPEAAATQPPAPPAAPYTAPEAVPQPPAAPSYEATAPYEAPVAPVPPAPAAVPGIAWAGEAPSVAAEPVPTAPVQVDAARKGPGRSPVKWFIAAVVALLVVGGAAGATLMLTSSASGASPVSGWAPKDTVTYVEVRLDMPGGQQAELAKFMAAFPGFADQAAFKTKLGEIGDRILGAATDNKHNYQQEIAPWFAGQIAMAQGPAPSMKDLQSGTLNTRALVILGTSDAAKATAWIDSIVKETGAKTSTEAYGDTTITIVKSGSGDMAGIEVPDAGYAFVGKVLLAGDTTSLKAAIDTKGNAGIAASDGFKAAQKAVNGNHLAFFYGDTKAAIGSSFETLESMDTSGMVKALAGIYDGIMPAWGAGSVYAKDGRLVMESVQPHVAKLGDPSNGADTIGALAPADTVFLASGRDLGARIKAMRALFDGEPAFKDALKQIDQALGVVGGFDKAVGWIGDTGLVITKQGAAVDGGLIIVPKDAADGKALLTQLRTLIELGAQGQLTFSDEEYKGTQIVSIDISQLAKLGSSMAGASPEAIPDGISLAWAATSDVIVMGVGPQFVKDVLDTKGGDSLAKQARYADAVASIGKESAGLFWLDITAIRGMVEPLIPAEAKSQYEKDVKPYLVPMDAIVGATVQAADLDRSTILITTTK